MMDPFRQQQQDEMGAYKFGQGIMTAGAGAYDQMYGMQNTAYSPYQTAQSGVQGLEAQGQNMLKIGAGLGNVQAQAGANQGRILQAGGENAAASRFNADSYSPWANALAGAGQAWGDYNRPQKQPVY